MKQFDVRDTLNPVYNTVTGLTNTTFDSTNIVPDRGATEGQLKSVDDILQALKDWLDENGCSDDPYIAIRQRLDQLQARQEECCNNPQDSIVQTLRTRLDQLQARIEECCEDPGGGGSGGEGYLPSQCVNNPTCDGGAVVVSVELTTDPSQPVGKKRGSGTATGGSTTGANIIGYAFLVETAQPGVYRKSATAKGGAGNYAWSIGGNGRLTMYRYGYTVVPFSNTIVAIDSNGCEGYITVNLPNFMEDDIIGG